MSKDTAYTVIADRNEYVAVALFISLHGGNNEKPIKQDIVWNIWFAAIFTSIKKNFFHQCVVDFKKLEFNDNKYQTNQTLID